MYAYAIARYKDGGYDFVVLDKGEVETRRSRSDSWKSDKSRPYSPWTTATDSMWKKSAIRELQKWIPKSAEMVKAESNDEKTLGFKGGVIASIDEDDLRPANVDDNGEITDAEIVNDEAAVDG